MRGSPGGRRPGSALPQLVLGAAAEQHCAGLSSSLEKPKKKPHRFPKISGKPSSLPSRQGEGVGHGRDALPSNELAGSAEMPFARRRDASLANLQNK